MEYIKKEIKVRISRKFQNFAVVHPMEFQRFSQNKSEIPTKIKKIGTKKHFVLQILRLVSLTEWELKIPNKPEKLNIVLLGMVLTNVQQSNIILKRIPDNYFFRPEVLDDFLKRK